MPKYVITAIIGIESTESEDDVDSMVQAVLEGIPGATTAYVETLINKDEEEDEGDED